MALGWIPVPLLDSKLIIIVCLKSHPLLSKSNKLARGQLGSWVPQGGPKVLQLIHLPSFKIVILSTSGMTIEISCVRNKRARLVIVWVLKISDSFFQYGPPSR